VISGIVRAISLDWLTKMKKDPNPRLKRSHGVFRVDNGYPDLAKRQSHSRTHLFAMDRMVHEGLIKPQSTGCVLNIHVLIFRRTDDC